MRRAAVAALFLTLIAASPARGLGHDPDATLAAVQAVLDREVAAVRAGDRAGYLATIDPQAPSSFRDAQARRFDGLRSVPLSAFSLRARTDESGDLAPGIAARHGGASVFLPETQQRLRLTGYDDRDEVSDLWFTYVQRGGRWYVGADDDLAAVGLDTNRDFWDLGPVRARPTPHFLVLSRPEQAARADTLAGVAERAAATLDQRWHAPWSHRVPLVLPSSTRELEVMLQSTVDLDKFVAFAAYGYDATNDMATTAARIYVNDANLSGYSDAQQVETLVHELDHVAVSGLAGPATPLWVHEGTAEWVAKPGGTRRRPTGAATTFPRDFEFVSGSQGAIVRAYAEARTAIDTLARKRGADAPAALLTELGRDRVAPGNVDARLDAALRRAASLTTADLERAWVAAR